MKAYRKFILVILLFAGVCMISYAQQDGPPAPRSQNKNHGDGPPCPDQDDDGPGPVVPPGFCLPIDTNIYFLMAIGVMYGAYKLRKLNTDLSP